MADAKKKKAEPRKPAAKPIERSSTTAWWCPVCDTSQLWASEACSGCGAVREGDKVTPA